MADTNSRGSICYAAPSFSLETDYRFAHKQCPGLADQGFNVSYFVQAIDAGEFKGVRIFPVETLNTKLKQVLLPWKMLSRLLKHPCDAYHLSTVEMLPVALVLKMITRKRVVFDFREDYVEFVRLKPYLHGPLKFALVELTRLLVWMVCKTMDGVVFGDEAVRDDLPQVPPDRQVFVHHFPLLSMYGENTIPFKDRKYDVVHTGALQERKGAFDILEAIRLLRGKHERLRVLLVGEPLPYIRKQFSELIERYDLGECIEITGRIPYEKVAPLLDNCKVGLISLHNVLKYRKQSSTKLFEYLAKGIPCVSVDLVPERRFLVSGKHGHLVPCQNPEAMAKAVYKILSNPQLGQKMASECRKHSVEEGYYGEMEMDSVAEFYDYVLMHRRRGILRS